MERIRILLKSQAISLKESVRSALLDSEAKLDRIFIHKYPSRFFERNLEALYVQNPHFSKNLSDFGRVAVRSSHAKSAGITDGPGYPERTVLRRKTGG